MTSQALEQSQQTILHYQFVFKKTSTFVYILLKYPYMTRILEAATPKRKTYTQKERAPRLIAPESYPKRAFDLFFASLFLLFFSPVFLLTAAAVKLTLKGPVIFKQKRAGFFGESFTMYKFRSIDHDIFATKLGEFLRKTYIDELPQFWNVICGQMSLVGPRPHILEQVQMYQLWQYRRLSVKPGITGLRQIECVKNDLDFNELIELDLRYIDNQSFWLDLKIIVKTFIVLTSRLLKRSSLH